ncbi:hypothetical protein HAZT_HAZT004354 [Hyalella azteca]|uniref:Methyltransferase FkbM domain-containing protein n=1 Tax=Hyalella azteca TaxID=294128 RepID=A0A6A0HBU0_HYAAZ|nr:hypothetical protein HAZT_HAZT004354 [Hyalella azteca]
MEKALRGPIAQDDPLLLEWILDKTAPPSREPYNLNYFFSGLSDEFNSSNPYSPSQEFILEHIENFFGAQINMPFVFVEAGAYDGEFLSNTLMLEKEHGWRGLLIEPNRKSFEKLLAKHRKAWAINACLSTNPFPSQVPKPRSESFTTVEASGKIDFIANAIPGAKPGPNGMNDTGKASSRLSRFYNYSDDTLRPAGRETVQCLPLYSITRALNMNHINLFSLDVEGAEMDILKTIPWGALTFTATGSADFKII